MFFIKLKKIVPQKRSQKNKKPRGFTLLFSILVSTLVLSVGLSVISIALRQLVISGTGRDSQYAFYAANTGIECALYWDLKSGTRFATSTDSQNFVGPMVCVDDDIAVILEDHQIHDNFSVDKYSRGADTMFRLEFDEIGPDSKEVPYCTDVVVKKEDVPAAGGAPRRIKTTIISSGYNTCDESNTRRIERGLEVTY